MYILYILCILFGSGPARLEGYGFRYFAMYL